MGVSAKFIMTERVVYAHHRSGWAYATAALEPLVTVNGKGILLDTLIEMNFWKRLAQARRNKVVPYRQPWVGFIHNPPGIPRWHDYRKSPRYFFQLATWRESMPFCQGLITLSARMHRWLQDRVNVPVLCLKHPTEMPRRTFHFESFHGNPKRRVVQIGLWLRRLCSIRELQVQSIRRAILLPVCSPQTRQRFLSILERERTRSAAPPIDRWDVEIIPYQSASCYDRLLAENIVFMHLYDSVANNTIIECIVRNTPVLVNPLPSVVEYLGQDYPGYYRTLEEAAAKAEDMSVLREAHEYLRSLSKDDLSADYFRSSLAESELYRRL
jgi:hypothetical protein